MAINIMNMEKDDIKFAALLKEASYQPKDDKWFIRGVMSRIPDKRKSYAWVEYVIYAICGLICGWCWKQFVGDLSVDFITVKEILKYFVLSGVTVMILWFTAKRIFVTD